jgi:hypothetical protein
MGTGVEYEYSDTFTGGMYDGTGDGGGVHHDWADPAGGQVLAEPWEPAGVQRPRLRRSQVWRFVVEIGTA